MDIAMPRLNGLEATRQILKAIPSTRILILTGYNDDAYVKSATESGAVGFMLKHAAASVLCEGIRQINKGHTFFGPFIAKLLPERERKLLDRAGRSKPRKAGLTSREMEVFQLIAEGKANKQIAAELDIGMKTVETHRERLIVKLNIHNTAGLTRHAISEGIIESNLQLTIV